MTTNRTINQLPSVIKLKNERKNTKRPMKLFVKNMPKKKIKTELYTTSLFESVFRKKEIFEFYVDWILTVILTQANMFLKEKQQSKILIFQSILLCIVFNSRKLIRPILSSYRDNNLFPLNIENRY
jgi:hypothetical protein